jgi:predicted MFS family arabinose efflux permease
MTPRITLEEVIKVLTTVLVVNTLFALLLFPWVTDEDISNLPKEPFDRFLTLFYFGVATFTTVGFGDVVAKSRRLKIIISLYILLAISGATSFFFRF